jgi:hypothetical protein
MQAREKMENVLLYLILVYTDRSTAPLPMRNTLFQKLRGGAGSKQYGMDFSRSHDGKEENPRNYNGLSARERKTTFHITLNQRQRLSFGTVYYYGIYFYEIYFYSICI